MPCIPIPDLPLPTLPSPLSIALPALPSITTPGLCCQLIPPLTLIPPIALPPLVANPAVIAAINAALDEVEAYVDALRNWCPNSA